MPNVLCTYMRGTRALQSASTICDSVALFDTFSGDADLSMVLTALLLDARMVRGMIEDDVRYNLALHKDHSYSIHVVALDMYLHTPLPHGVHIRYLGMDSDLSLAELNGLIGQLETSRSKSEFLELRERSWHPFMSDEWVSGSTTTSYEGTIDYLRSLADRRQKE